MYMTVKHNRDDDCGYFIKVNNYNDRDFSNDYSIAGMINMGKREFQNLLEEQFNGHMDDDDMGIFFRYERDIEKAINWIDCTVKIHELGR